MPRQVSAQSKSQSCGWLLPGNMVLNVPITLVSLKLSGRVGGCLDSHCDRRPRVHQRCNTLCSLLPLPGSPSTWCHGVGMSGRQLINIDVRSPQNKRPGLSEGPLIHLGSYGEHFDMMNRVPVSSRPALAASSCAAYAYAL